MNKRPGRPPLPYKTDTITVNIRREYNEYMDKLRSTTGLNKSKLLNELLKAHYEGKLCRHCYRDSTVNTECNSCFTAAVVCIEEGCRGARFEYFRRCTCSFKEFYNLKGPEPAPSKARAEDKAKAAAEAVARAVEDAKSRED